MLVISTGNRPQLGCSRLVRRRCHLGLAPMTRLRTPGRECSALLVRGQAGRDRAEQHPIPRHSQSPTAAHAYASSLPLARQADITDSPLPTAKQMPVQQQHKRPQHSLHHESAYTFVAPNWDPLVGRSRQHQRVEKDVLQASGSHAPLVVSGDVGLNTLRVAATVHALGLEEEDVSHPMVVVDCSSASGVKAASQLLLGGLDGLPAAADYSKSSVDVAHDALLLSALTDGTLVLNNVHKAAARLLALADAAIAALLPVGASKSPLPAAAAAAAPTTEHAGSFLKAHRTRLVLVSQLPLAQLTQQLQELPGAAPEAAASPQPAATASLALGLPHCRSIALSALRARSSDIGPLAVLSGQAAAWLRGYRSIELTDAAEKQLTSYDFPGNEAELKGLVQRAVMLHPPAPTAASKSHGSGSSLDVSGCSCDGGCSGSSDSGSDGSMAGCCGGPGGCGSSSGEGVQAPVLVLDAGDFWAATGTADRARVDVLQVMPWLRKFVLDTGLWPLGLNRITQFLYPLILASLFLGPQDRESSAALTVFWAGWWPLVMLSYPFVGRAWCAMCPFMITGEAAQGMLPDDSSSGNSPNKSASSNAPGPAQAQSAGVLGVAAAAASAGARNMRKLSSAAAGVLPQGWQLQKWPTEAIEPWAGWFVIAAFAGILMWEQVWDLPQHAALSGWLLVLITAGAVACSVVWEKRLWCRYLCPIGAMNGLFAKLSMTEIRSRPGLCAAAACTKPCHKGRIEHETVEAPCPNPAGCTAPASFSISSLLPWSNSNNSSCAGGDNSCSSCGYTMPSVSASQPQEGFSTPSVYSCSAVLDMYPTAADVGSGVTVPAGADAGVMTVEREVVLPGCPMNSYPGKNIDNHLCIMCGNCLRSCTSGSAQWRLRPPAADLWMDHQASWTELHLMNVLLGSVLLHRLPEVCAQLGLPADQITSDKAPHLLLCAAILAAPSAISWAWHKAATAVMTNMASRTASARRSAAAVLTGNGSGPVGNKEDGDAQQQQHGDGSLLRMSYSTLPLVWAGILSHYEGLLLTELCLLLPRFAISLGFSPDTPWLSTLPALGPAPGAVVGAAQGLTLFVGAVLSLALAGKIGSVEVQQGRVTEEEMERSVVPQRLLTLLMAAELWHIIL